MGRVVCTLFHQESPALSSDYQAVAVIEEGPFWRRRPIACQHAAVLEVEYYRTAQPHSQPTNFRFGTFRV
jgi:hypothetical protein